MTMDAAEPKGLPAKPKRPLTEAIDEVFREMCVRKRIYGRWVDEGKLTWQQANDQGERMEAALQWLMDHPLCPAGYAPSEPAKKEYRKVF